MKKSFLLFVLIMLALLPGIVLSQEYHIIGDEESNTRTYYAPFMRNDNYSISSVLYIQSEMEEAKLLTHIAFDKYEGSVETEINNAAIYVKHTDADYLEGYYYYDLSDYVKVWEGKFPNDTATGWHEVELDTYFEYNGVENLQFLFMKDYEESTEYYPFWRYSPSSSTHVLYATGWEEMPEAVWYEYWYYSKPNIRFQYQEAGPVSVSTVKITEIINSSAASGGGIINRGDADLITSKGVCWNTSGSPTVADSKTDDGDGEDDFTSSITGLSQLTTYYVRAYVEYDEEIYYGQETYFETLPNVIVTTDEITDISHNSASSGGTIINYLEEDISSKGVCWNKTGTPTIDDDKTNDGEGEDAFTSEITGLDEISEYYVRAYAVCDGETYYGNELVFQTLPESVDEPTDTDGNGYRNVSTLSHLLWISLNSDYWADNFELDNDIDAYDTRDWYNGKGFNAIGNNNNPFTGEFNGNGNKIENLYINRPNQSYVGLFGYVSDGNVISNLAITDVNITGGDFTGAIAGYMNWSKIDNCSVTGEVFSSSEDIGGLIGFLSGAIVHNVNSDVDVTGSERVGGLFGSVSEWSEVRRAYSKGSVEGTNDVGGFAGAIGTAGEYHGMPGYVFDCYTHSAVTGVSNIGGFAGSLNDGLIYRSFSSGSVEGSQGNVGGFLGYENSGNEWDGKPDRIFFCYWDTQTSGQTTSAGEPDVVGRTTSQMYQEDSFEKYNFSVLWQLDEGNYYPEFQDATLYSQPVDVKLSELDGSGTAEDPYIITNLNELNAVRNGLSLHYKLGNDIDMSHAIVWDYGRGWTPLGNSQFSGSFDGDGYKIQNLYISRGEYYQGLFGRASNAEITNFNIENGYVYADSYIGMLGGEFSNCVVTDISVEGTIITYGTYTGGLIGYVIGGTVRKTSSYAEIFGKTTVGGLIGAVYNNADIMHSYTDGYAEGSNTLGGFIGQLGGWSTASAAFVYDCYSHTEVKMNGEGQQAWNTGGFIGYLYNGTINRSYSTGFVSSEGMNTGGFAGRADQTGTGNFCYWDTETSDMETSAGGEGVVGSLTDDMKTREHYHSSWNFNLLWDIDSEINYGYPHFNFRTIPVTEGIEPLDTNGNGYRNIYLFAHLVWVSENDSSWTWNLELDCDINASASFRWDNFSGFSPIGNNTKRFTGTFNGNGFSIDSIYISRTASDYQGLFGFIENAEILNLHLKNADILGGRFTAGIAGRADYSLIEKVSSSASVVSSGLDIGSIAGYIIGSVVRFSYSEGSVEGYQRVGGFIGQASSASISDCYSHSSAKGDATVAGFVAANFTSAIVRSYSTGEVIPDGWTNGGFVASKNGMDYFASSYYDRETAGIWSDNARGNPKTTEEMQNQDTYVGWNFESIWDINSEDNSGYPFFNFRTEPVTEGIEPLDTDDNGYRNISEFAHLVWVSENSDSWGWNYELDNDIDASESIYWETLSGFSPIGNVIVKFSGEFDGKGYSIDNLYINSPHRSYQALFGYLEYAKIYELSLTNANIAGGGYYDGGLAGRADNSIIEHCSYSGFVATSYSYYVGGLIGYINNCNIRFSYSEGVTEGSQFIGGFVGYSVNSVINDCYSRASSLGARTVGGFMGYNNSNIYRSYSTGFTRASWWEAGGFLANGSSAIASYWDRNTSAQNGSAGGATGLNTAQMKSKDSYDASWNFFSIWDIDSTINDGYPYLNINTIPVTESVEPLDTNGNGYRNVYMLAHLVWVSENDSSWSWNYEMDCDINASASFRWDNFSGFSPIGNNTTAFTGKFDGKGFAIDSLYINYESQYTGLFGNILNAEIRNLKLRDFSISGSQYTAGLAGYADKSHLNEIFISGNVASTNDYIGLLCGYIKYSEVNNIEIEDADLDGKNYTGSIAGYIDNSDLQDIALKNVKVSALTLSGGAVGYIKDSEANEIDIHNISVNAQSNIGGFAGRADDSDFRFISVTRDADKITTYRIIGSGSNVGGMFGYVQSGTLYNLSSEINVHGQDNVGGMIGVSYSFSEISRSYSKGSVSGSNYVGGFFGRVYYPKVFDCFSRASSTGSSNVGGFAGSASYGSITRAYSTGFVSSSGSNVGGFLGGVFGGAYSNSFWDTETSLKETSAGGAGVMGRTTLQMLSRTNYDINWNFDFIWSMNFAVNNGYPYIDDRTIPVTEGIEPTDTDGNGYRNISLFAHLVWVSENDSSWSWNFELDNNINAAPSFKWTTLIGFSPIGATNKPFTGKFDGKGFTIDSLFISRDNQFYVGLFGSIEGADAEVRDLNLTNFDFYGSSYVGGLAGRIVDAYVSSVKVEGKLAVKTNYAGGLAATVSNASVINSNSNVTVTGASYLGGFIGYVDNNSEVSRCFAEGSITGSSYIGGFTGFTSSSLIKESYSHTTVSGGSYIGGFAGYRRENIVNCYSTGKVTGTGSFIGGFLGQSAWGGTSQNCYWDKETSEMLTSANGTGLTTDEMKEQINYHSSWSFRLLWNIDPDINYGYPYIFDRTIPITEGIEPQDTDGNGYRNISLFAHLVWVSENDSSWSWKFELDNDIDASSTYFWDNYEGFSPIGSSAIKFTGEFNGNGYTISELFIERPSLAYQGLFGYINNAYIWNLNLEDFYIYGASNTAILAGRIDNSYVEFVNVSGEILSNSFVIGGIAGYLNASYLMSVFSNADITSTNSSSNNNIGGIVGYMFNNSEITYSGSRGSITGGKDNVGGLIGYSNSGVITDCYSHASVTGTANVGGLIGYKSGNILYRSFSTGEVTGTGNNVGGLTGYNWGASVFCYWDTGSSGLDESSSGTGLTNEEMQQQASFAQYNFSTLWQIDEGNDYPEFRDLTDYEKPIALNLTDLEGSGSETDPYVIHNANELNVIRQDLNAHYRLAGGIDLSSSIVWNYGRGWEPLGTSSTQQRFYGSLSGGGYVVEGLHINMPNRNYVGLFGYCHNATLRNINIENSNVYGKSYVALLSGYLQNTTVENISLSGHLVSNEQYTGGFAGYIDAGTITAGKAVNIDIYSNSNLVGGFAGYMLNGASIQKSYSEGLVRGLQLIGGLVGSMASSLTKIEDSYSRAEVAGTDRVGGLIGNLSSGNVSKSYSTGLVTGTENRVGGFIGSSMGTASYCYWDTETSEMTTSAGGVNVIGRSTDLMKTQFNYATWNFTNIWAMSSTVNDGYPFLRVFWQMTPPTLTSPDDLLTDAGVEINFEWFYFTNTAEFNLQIADNDDFENPEIDEIIINELFFNATDLAYSTTYFWRVRAVTGDDTTDWSGVRSFTTRPVIYACELIEPENNSVQLPINQTFFWFSNIDASSYEIHISESSDFADLLHNEELNDTTYEATFEYNKTYFRRVRGIDGNDIGDWSEIWNFNTDVQRPVLTGPEDLAVCVAIQPEFEWEDNPQHDAYKLQVSSNINFSNLIINEDDIQTNSYASEIEFNQMQTYYWKVKGYVGDYESEWSDIFEFMTINVDPIDEISGMLPASNTHNLSLPINFSWSPAQYADSYDLYIWNINDNDRPEFPVAADISTINYTFTGPLAYGEIYNWQLIAKNDCNERESSVSVFSLRKLPDVIVTEVTGPEEVTAGQNMTVSWYVKNNGEGSTVNDSWFDSVYLSVDSVFNPSSTSWMSKRLNFSSLNPNQVYNQTATFTVPRHFVGYYYIFVKANSNNKLLETDTDNNMLRADDRVEVIPPPLPDLVMESVASPSPVFSGTKINVSYTIRNEGNAPVYKGYWWDAIYISTDSSGLTQEAVFLTSVYRNGVTIQADASNTISREITIPVSYDGTYYIYVEADRNSRIAEITKDNNTARTAGIEVVKRPPPDFIVSSITSPATVTSGTDLNITYKITNQGFNAPLENSWRDKIILSSEPELTDAGIVLSSVQTIRQTTGWIFSDNTDYTRSVTFNLPKGISGEHYIFVQTDELNEVYEYDDDNNSLRSSLIDIELAPYPDLVVDSLHIPGTGVSGNPITVSWKVKNQGDTLAFSPWDDAVYFSPLDYWHPAIVQKVHTYRNLVNLDSSGSYEVQQSFVVPDDYSGAYYIYIKTDNENDVFEHIAEDNNITRSEDAILIENILSSFSDLEVFDMQLPDEVLSGEVVNISFKVRNNGPNATIASTWFDKLYFSETNQIEEETTVLLTRERLGRLDSGRVYTINASLEIPNGINGDYYFIVKTDTEGKNINETDLENNVKEQEVEVGFNPSPDLSMDYEIDTDVSPGQVLDIPYTVTNLNVEVPTLEWMDGAYVGDEGVEFKEDSAIAKLNISRIFEEPLKKDSSYSLTMRVTIPKVTGTNYLTLKADLNDKIFEYETQNNYKSVLLNISYPDLRLDTIILPDIIYAGQRIEAEYTVTNYGDGTAYAINNPTERFVIPRWTDNFLINNSPVIVRAQRIGAQTINTPLLPGESYTKTVTINIPVNLEGYYYLMGHTDSGDNVFEDDEDNNVYKQLIEITLPEPSNLIVANVQSPDSVILGEQATISYSIKNIGENPAFGYINDASYLSLDDLLNPQDDRVFSSSGRYINLQPDHSMNLNMQNRVQGFNPNDYYPIVSTNIRSTISESNYDDNTLVGEDLVNVGIKQLYLDVVETKILNFGDLLFYRIEVPADNDLLINLESNKPDLSGSNEMYLAYDRVPTLTDYDYKNIYPANVNQKILAGETSEGEYYLMIRALNGYPANSMQSVDILAKAIPFSITALTPNPVGQARVTTTILGGGLQEDTKFYLYEPGTDSIVTEGLLVERKSSMQVKVRWNLDDIALGFYEVAAVNGEDTVFADEPLEIEKPDDYTLGEYEMMPYSVRTGTKGNYYFRYTNTSNVDIPYLNTDVVFLYAADIKNISKSTNVALLSEKARKINNYLGVDSLVPENNFKYSSIHKYMPVYVRNLAPGEDFVISFDVDRLPYSSVRGNGNFEFLINALAMNVQGYLTTKLFDIETMRFDILRYPDVYEDFSDLRHLASKKYEFRDSMMKIAILTGDVSAEDTLGLHALHMRLDSLYQAGEFITGDAFDYRFTDSTDEGMIDFVNNYKKFTDADNHLLNNTGDEPNIDVTQFDPCAHWKALGYTSGWVGFIMDAAGAVIAVKAAVTAPAWAPIALAGYGVYKVGRATWNGFWNWYDDKEHDTDAALETGIAGADAGINLAQNAGKLGGLDGLGKGAIVNSVVGISAEWLEENCRDKEEEKCYDYITKYIGMNQYGVPEHDRIKREVPCPEKDPEPEECFEYYVDWVYDPLEGAKEVVLKRKIKCKDPKPPRKKTGTFVSSDPNDITGPEGYGEERWISVNDVMPFRIRFENDSLLATAPAQRVIITQTFDSTVNPLSFRLGNFGFANMSFEVPANLPAYYTVLDLPDSLGYDVEVTAGFNATTDQAFWVFQSIDPATGFPPANPMAGLLPINDSTGIGEGFVTYTVRPKQSCVTGDYIVSRAEIIFDANETIHTPDFTNRVDALPPISDMFVDKSDISDSTFVVFFTGQDDEGGTGIKTYELYVSVDEGDYYLYESTEENSLIFYGDYETNYSLMSIAVDNVNNMEVIKSVADTVLLIERTAPKLVRPRNQSNLPSILVNFKWEEYQDAEYYQLQISTNNLFLSNTETVDNITNTNVNYSDIDINTVYFWRIRANTGSKFSKWSETWSFTADSLGIINKPVSIAVAYSNYDKAAGHRKLPVVVELRDGSSLMSSEIIAQKSSIVNIDGVIDVNFGDVQDGDYWLILRAGGFMPVATPDKQSLSTEGIEYDFTLSSDKSVLGANAMVYKDSKWQVRPGDLDADGGVGAFDVNALIPNIGRSVSNGIPENDTVDETEDEAFGKPVTITLSYKGYYSGTEHKKLPVIVELRDGETLMTSTIVSQESGLVNADGEIEVNFGDTPDGDYWLIVRAGGFMPVATPNKHSLSAAGIDYDFTTSSDKSVLGTNAMVNVGGVWQIRPGDFDSDGGIGAFDVNILIPHIGRSVSNGIPVE